MSDLTLTTRFVARRLATGGTDRRRFATSMRTALRVYLTRRALPELTARELADIGVSAAAAASEAARLPWDMNPRPRRASSGILAAVQRAFERARTRRLLSRMQARELRDIGVSPSNAQAEATKAFWQL